jgi:colanic acid biosynthesis glycosyl transferase WcaI
VVMYSGNMGLGHRFETILAAARSLASNNKIHFVFIGEGARKPQIDAWRQTHNLSTIIMLPYQPRERLRETLSAGDIHLISLDAQVQGFIVPSKLAGILAVGRPVMFLGNEQNSIATAILQAHCGYVIPEGDVSRLRRIVAMSSPKEMSAASRRSSGDSGRTPGAAGGWALRPEACLSGNMPGPWWCPRSWLKLRLTRIRPGY